MGSALSDWVGTAAYRLALLVLRAWWVVRRPRSSGVRCVLRHGATFVLVRHSYGDRGWMLPGGRVRRGEHPIDAARREMQQELGIQGRAWREIGILPARARFLRRSRGEDFRRHATHYIECHVEGTELRPRRAEIREAGWFRVDELPGGCSDAVDVAIRARWLPSAG